MSFLILLLLASSCSVVEKSASGIEENKLYVTRMYVGNYLDYRHTSPDKFGNPDLIWISTTLDSIHGKISAYGIECGFTKGERLYLRRVMSGTGKNARWIYQVENNSSAYPVNEYQNHNDDMVEAWFGTTSEDPVQYYLSAPEPVAQKADDHTENTSGSN